MQNARFIGPFLGFFLSFVLTGMANAGGHILIKGLPDVPRCMAEEDLDSLLEPAYAEINIVESRMEEERAQAEKIQDVITRLFAELSNKQPSLKNLPLTMLECVINDAQVANDKAAELYAKVLLQRAAALSKLKIVRELSAKGQCDRIPAAIERAESFSAQLKKGALAKLRRELEDAILKAAVAKSVLEEKPVEKILASF